MTDTKPGLIYAKIPAVMKRVRSIAKNQTNKFDGYDYRGIDDLYNALHGPCSEEGVFIVPHSVDSVGHRDTLSAQNKPQLETSIVETFRIYAEDGSYIEAQVSAVGVDRGDKGPNKAHTAAFKTLCFELFMPPLHDDTDSEKDSPERAAPSKPAKPRKPATKPAQDDGRTLGDRDALIAAKRGALDAVEDIRLGEVADGGMSSRDLLARIAREEYGPDGPQTAAQVEALVEMVRAHVWDLSTGERIPEGI